MVRRAQTTEPAHTHAGANPDANPTTNPTGRPAAHHSPAHARTTHSGVRGDLVAEAPDGEKVNSMPGLKRKIESHAALAASSSLAASASPTGGDADGARPAKRRKESAAPSPAAAAAAASAPAAGVAAAEGGGAAWAARVEVTKQELSEAHPAAARLVGSDVCVLAAARPKTKVQSRRSVGWRASMSTPEARYKAISGL